jgi:hypothetical protein
LTALLGSEPSPAKVTQVVIDCFASVFGLRAQVIAVDDLLAAAAPLEETPAASRLSN